MIHIYDNFNQRIIRNIFLIIPLFLTISIAVAQVEPSVIVKGEVQRHLTLDTTDLLKMKRVKATLNDRGGVSHVYEGVPITNILDSAGVTLHGQLRGENLSKYLLVKCGDGYQVLFSLAELDESFTDKVVILADRVDGKSISDGRGPFRLVVPGEKVPARSSFEVTALIIGSAKD
ncbi:molybdopterin-dependent oxidoreductase [Olivibacter domesticus]|uniref:Oxidoreductase molybdopterin binding domain-containing protein n=1 Tax=Olivibacter domesticus TaxID=407022 RepID=A0A1H7RAH2_OLID1|nr:molybdopterin-dependent oxidoreductase [Olivibacter domesticus]SEL57193.1 Oxidoreductase molybdopterin binding domain-containing protein [Olivibacter domesticus]